MGQEVYAEISAENNKDSRMRIKIIPQDMEKLKSKLLDFSKGHNRYCVLNCKCSKFTIKAEDYFAETVTEKELEQGIKNIEDDLASVLANTETLNEIVTEDVQEWAENDKRLKKVVNNVDIDIEEIIKTICNEFNKECIWNEFSTEGQSLFLYYIIIDGKLLEYVDKEALPILLQDYTLKEIKEKIDGKKGDTDRII